MNVSDVWYSHHGDDDDVVLSSRVRLARNLANFPFPTKFRGSDGERIRSIVFDAFNQLDNAESYHSIAVNQFMPSGTKVLIECGILEPVQDDRDCGVVVRADGKVSCTVNICDHVRIAVFSSGLDFALSEGRYVDAGLQKSVQFAASYDFGYLTSSLFDAGSGMKLSCRLHLPALTLLGRIGSVGDSLGKKGFSFTATYGLGSKGSSLGAFYTASSLNCRAGTEFDQSASMQAAMRQIVEQERLAREQCSRELSTMIKNSVYRSYALANYSMLLDTKEAIEIISGLKLGMDIKLLEGTVENLNALLYRIQDGHLELALKDCHFDLEEDISQSPSKKNERLRALVLKETAQALYIA